jgi:hypothetical protein
VIYDTAQRQYPTVTELTADMTVGGYVYVQVSDTCTKGPT